MPLNWGRSVFTDLSCLSILSQSFHEFVILMESTDGFHRGLEQEPTEHQDSYCESDFPCPRHLWVPPNQGQRQRTYGRQGEDNNGFSEIPWKLFLGRLFF